MFRPKRNNLLTLTQLVNTAISARQGKIPFPRIPSVNTMLAQNLTTQPVFFGCNAALDSRIPLVLYLPNSPWSAYTNYTYTKSSFTDNQLDVVLDNAFQIATYGNETVDRQWPVCLACATIKKAVQRLKMAMPEACQACFERHCWNGQEEEEKVQRVNGGPRLRFDPGLGYKQWEQTVWEGGEQ